MYAIYIYERNLLTNKDWKFFASIADYMNELAEACPDVFLERLQNLLESKDEAFLTFLHEKENFIVEQKYGYQLSETLRHLAISENYFARTMLALLKLAEYQDLFLNTLVTIVLPWYPQTNADLNIRTGVFKGLAKENEDITWNALMKLMPNITTNSTEILGPNYMHEDTLPGHVSERDYFTAIRSYVLIAVSLIKGNTDRIIDMIGVIDDVPEDLQNEILKAVYDNSLLLSDSEKEKIWNKKEDFVNRHRKFADANWALNEERLLYIENFLKKLWPDINSYNLVRLFKKNQFPLMKGENWEEWEKKLQDKQISEVTRLYRTRGMDEILILENKVENIRLLGRTLAYVFSKEEFKTYIEEQPINFSSEFTVGLLEAVDREWIFEVVDNADQKIGAQILALVFADNDIIARVQKMEEPAQKIYFENLRVCGLSEMAEEKLLFLLDGINSASRIDAWIYVMYEVFNNFEQRPNEEYLIDGLLEMDISYDIASHELFELQQLLKFAQENCKKYDKVLALEWKFLNILDESVGLYPINLWNEMADKPEFFMELIKTVAGKRKDEMSAEEASKMYSHNYKLLHGWKTIPGKIEDGKNINCKVLKKWFSEVRRISLEEEITDVAMDFCGKLFFYAPEDVNGFFINLDIAEIIEHEPNDYIRTGYEIEAINSRGCITVDPTGRDDFENEEVYMKKAKAAEAEGFIRLADSLRSVANSFHEEGLMHQRMY